jgi:hypothetical protein
MRSRSQTLSHIIIAFLLVSGISFFCLAIPAQDSPISYLLPDVLGWVSLFNGLIVIIGISLTDEQATIIILTAFLLRAALAIVNAYVVPLPYSQADAANFEAIGWMWSQDGLIASLDNFQSGSDLYPWLISVVYTLTSRSSLMIQGFNVLFGSLIVWNVYLIAKLLWGMRVAVRAAWFTTLIPSLALYSAVTLREVAIVYPLTLAILYLAYWHRSKKTLHLVFSLISLGVSISFHTGIIFALVTLMFIFLLRLLFSVINPRNLFLYTGSLLLISSFVGMVIMSGWGLQKIGGSVENISLQQIAQAQQVRARDRAAYLEDMPISDPIDLVWQTPWRVIYFLYTPFVWMIRTSADLAAQLDVLLYIGLTISLYRSRRYIIADPAARAILLMLLALIIIFALSTSNYGTALRHRAKFAPIAMSLTAVAPWERRLRGVQRA